MQDSTGTQYYVVQDQLGSMRGLVRRDGKWVMSQRFTPYGTLLSRDSVVDSLPRGLHVGWTGREYDAETGFTFHRARYYSPDLRRWTQEDPIGYAGGGNLYAYVGGAVMEARDPSGLIETITNWGPMGDEFADPTTGVAGQDLAGGDTCLLFCTSARDRMQQEQDKFFRTEVTVTVTIHNADGTTSTATYTWDCSVCDKMNLETGNKLLDDFKIRTMLEFVAGGGPLKGKDFGGGIKGEVGGWCTASACTWRQGDPREVGIQGDRPDGALLAYHTHPNKVGSSWNGMTFSADGPSNWDFGIASRRNVPSFVIERSIIWGYGTQQVTPYRRWR